VGQLEGVQGFAGVVVPFADDQTSVGVDDSFGPPVPAHGAWEKSMADGIVVDAGMPDGGLSANDRKKKRKLVLG
jgi:hypothetical protein